MTPEVRFMIVGSPRSGTTLLQRLVGELDGVRVPFETHFFTKGLDAIVPHGTFPLTGPALTAALDAYLGLDVLAGSGLERTAVEEALGGRADSPLALFDAVTASAAGLGTGPGGEATVLGEKTPGHHLWVVALARRRPALRIIGVIRDPRAVVASQRAVPWGQGRADVLATRWASVQQGLAHAADALGDAFLTVRYEALVADPTGTRDVVADFLGVPVPAGAPAAAVESTGGLDWEHWKAGATGAITTESIDRWRTSLTPVEVRAIEQTAGVEMARWGYAPGPASPLLRVRAAVELHRGRHRRAAEASRDAAARARVAATDLG